VVLAKAHVPTPQNFYLMSKSHIINIVNKKREFKERRSKIFHDKDR
jgi:hypothetical protein